MVRLTRAVLPERISRYSESNTLCRRVLHLKLEASDRRVTSGSERDTVHNSCYTYFSPILSIFYMI